jgi:hypothetical protein
VQTSPTVPGGRYTSAPITVQTVTVYAPTPVPTISSAGYGTVTSGAAISGRGVSGATVVLYDSDGSLVGTAPVVNGVWTATTNVLSLGRHTLTAKQQDGQSGFVSASSSTFVVTVLPDAPKISIVTVPALWSTSTTVMLTGTGVTGYTATIYDNGVYKGTASVVGGQWTYAVAVSSGSHSFTVTQTSPASTGSFTSAASTPSVVNVYAAPTITSGLGNVFVGSPSVVSGLGVAGATVALFEGTTQVGTALVNSSGTWTTNVTLAAAGVHSLVAKQQDASGYWSASSTSIAIGVYANPGAPAILTVSTPAATKTTTPVTITGSSSVAGQTITVYDGGYVVGQVTTTATGWTLTLRLASGTHALTFTQSPAAGLESAATSRTVVVPRAP